MSDGDAAPETSAPKAEHTTMHFQRTFIHYLQPWRNATTLTDTKGNKQISTGWSKLPWQSTNYYLKDSDLIGMANLSTRWRMKEITCECSQFTAIQDVTSGVAGSVDLTVQPSNMGWFFVYKDDKHLLFPDNLGDTDDENRALPNSNGLFNVPASRDDGLLQEYQVQFGQWYNAWEGYWKQQSTSDISVRDYELLNTDQWSIHHAGSEPIVFTHHNTNPNWNLLTTYDVNGERPPMPGSMNPRVIAGLPINNKWSAWGNMHAFIQANRTLSTKGSGEDLTRIIEDNRGGTATLKSHRFFDGSRSYGPEPTSVLPAPYNNQPSLGPNNVYEQKDDAYMFPSSGAFGGDWFQSGSQARKTAMGVALKDAVTGDEHAHPVPGVLFKPMPIYTLNNELHKMTFLIVAKYKLTCEFQRNEFRFHPRGSNLQQKCDSWLGCNATGIEGWQLSRKSFQ